MKRRTTLGGRTTVMAAFLSLTAPVVGCAKYQTIALRPLQPEFHSSALTTELVSACYELLDATNSKRYFNKDLKSVGYQPVQFTVVNESRRYLTMDVSQISVFGAEPEAVAKKCHFNTAGRATAYGVAGIFIWPLLVPAVVDGVGSSKANTQMDLDFAAKALKNQVIMPHGTTNGVLFVPTDQLTAQIVMRLTDRDTGESFVFQWSEGKPIVAKLEPAGQDKKEQ